MRDTKKKPQSQNGLPLVRHQRPSLGFRQSCAIVLPYAWSRLRSQLFTIGAIVVGLVGFEFFVLGQGPSRVLSVALGAGGCALGLALFLEGVFLALMPLGEVCGLKLPQKAGLVVSLAVAVILGAGATLAEPALVFLRGLGSSVLPWESPLLYSLLNGQSRLLLLSICVGVGLAVALGLLRSLHNLVIKPFIVVGCLVALGLSLVASLDPRSAALIGLAWDSGGITTGPVTVPLVLSLGMGLSRVASSRRGAGDGFGIVSLASILPVACVLSLGLFLAPQSPSPGSRQDFFSAAQRSSSLALVGGTTNYLSLARAHLDPAEYSELSLSFSDVQRARAQESSRDRSLSDLAISGFSSACQAILPLVAFLLLVLLLLRSRLAQPDEFILGLFLALAGLFLFNVSVGPGLVRPSDESGARLSQTFKRVELSGHDTLIKDFDPEETRWVFDSAGNRVRVFEIIRDGRTRLMEYQEARYDPLTRVYRLAAERGPLFGPGRELLGLAFLLLFAALLGYGVTMAEPSLHAMGQSVEDLSVGTLKKSALVAATAVGSGLGLALGFLRIYLDLPLAPLLGGVYALLIALSLFVEDDFVAIAWDAAGVTTGPVTVPVVVALGLGFGSSLGRLDCFGLLAFASAFPIASVLIFGLKRRFTASRGREKE